jgi:hypothetical protein
MVQGDSVDRANNRDAVRVQLIRGIVASQLYTRASRRVLATIDLSTNSAPRFPYRPCTTGLRAFTESSNLKDGLLTAVSSPRVYSRRCALGGLQPANDPSSRAVGPCWGSLSPTVNLYRSCVGLG